MLCNCFLSSALNLNFCVSVSWKIKLSGWSEGHIFYNPNVLITFYISCIFKYINTFLITESETVKMYCFWESNYALHWLCLGSLPTKYLLWFMLWSMLCNSVCSVSCWELNHFLWKIHNDSTNPLKAVKQWAPNKQSHKLRKGLSLI